MSLVSSHNITSALSVALVVSAAIHGLVVLGATTLYSVPPLDIEFTVPTEVEFGLTDETSATLSSESAPALPAQEEQAKQSGDTADELSSEEQARLEEEKKRKAELARKAREARRKQREEEARLAQEAREAELAKSKESAKEEVRLPAGAQIALRLDMARVRASPLRDSVTRLLAEIPDWQMLLAGSDIQPVEQIDQLMVASATLQRGSWLIAGRLAGATDQILPITEKMASSRGQSALWKTAHGVRTAPWHDDEPAEHVVAVWDEKHFSITRPDDLPRLMAVAGALANANEEDKKVTPTELAATLMEMSENEAIKIDVEGARRFARAPSHIVPRSLRLSVLEVEGGATLLARATFDSVSQAQQGKQYWEGLRDDYARKTIIRAMGYGRLLDGIAFEQEGDVITATSQISYREIQTILGFVENWLRSRNQQMRQRQEALERNLQAAPEGTPSAP